MAKDDFKKDAEYEKGKRRRRGRVKQRRNQLISDKSKGERRWIKSRRRVRKNLLSGDR